MAYTTRSTTRTKPSLMSRLTGKHHKTTTTTRTTKHHHKAAPVHHHKRKPSLKDKVSGAMLKLKGTLTHRPGEKAAGTRRMRGTDGKGSHRTKRHY